MNWLIVRNDLKRNKLLNVALLLFMMFSASLAVLSVAMGVQTFTSISELYQTANPPHFLQMHKGELEKEKIQEFMSSYEGVTHSQIQTMMNVYGESLTVTSGERLYNLSDFRISIGLVKQNEVGDLLLNSDHKKVKMNPGEMGIPVLLKNRYGIKIGDSITLKGNNISREFVVKEIILDSQMNSSMTSSTRVLLSDEDFNDLEGKIGEKEYLIETYFTDTKEASDFQTAYETANLPQNGPAITYTMIFMLSALTDILLVFIMLLTSILLIIISFICVRFTIMAVLEEEIHEIGTMKAIGLTFLNIRDIYLRKYRILAMAAVLLGYIFAIIMSGVFTRHISDTFGIVSLSPLTIGLSLIAGLLVYVLIDYYSKKVLRKIKTVTVVDALVIGNGFNKKKNRTKDGLYKSKKMQVNWLLGVREVFYGFKNWGMVFAVVLISEMIILIPFNVMNTFEDPGFITYMGSSPKDILIEVENGNYLENSYKNIKGILDNDNSIKEYNEYGRVRVQTLDGEAQIVNLHIDRGENSGSDLQYLSGKAPTGINEIAISYLNGEKLAKSVGDKIVLLFNNKEQEFVISGIYQDVTGGGYSAKAIYAFPELDSEKYSFSVNLVDDRDVVGKADALSKLIGTGVKVEPMEEFINQTLGGVVNQLRTLVLAIGTMGAIMVVLITVLFLKLRLAKDLSDIGILKAIGFSNKDIKQLYLIKMGTVSVMGLLIGIILTNLLGGKIVNMALGISGLGIKSIELTINPFVEYFALPLFFIVMISLVTRVVVSATEKYNMITIMNE